MKLMAYGLSLALAFAPAYAAELTPAQVFKTASPSVVTIFIVDEAGTDLTQGSGVTFRSGQVITNCHLMKHTGSIKISYKDKRYPAMLMNRDAERDLCIVAAPSLPAPPATMGHSESVEIGDPVYAIGAPQGFDLTLSDGLLSGRRGKGADQILQITAPISVGSSGGGLFDAAGKLIGITTLIHKEAQQINFAVPVEWIADLETTRSSAARGDQAAADAAADAAAAAADADADAAAAATAGQTKTGKVYSYEKDGVRYYRSTPPPAGTPVREIKYQYKDTGNGWYEAYRDQRVTVTFKYISGDLATGIVGWEKYTRATPMTVVGVREKVAYTMARKQIRCRARTTALAEVIYYSADGRVLSSAGSQFGAHEAVVPDSVGEAVLDAICE